MLNKAMLIGRVGKEVELNTTVAGVEIAKFTLATSESRKVNDNWQEKTEWHNLTAFNKTAGYCKEYIKKGQLVYVEGKITSNSWQDDKGGKHYRTEIVISSIKKISTGHNTISQPQPQIQQEPQNQQQQESDLPF